MKIRIDPNDLEDLVQQQFLLRLAIIGIESLIEKAQRHSPFLSYRESVYSDDDH